MASGFDFESELAAVNAAKGDTAEKLSSMEDKARAEAARRLGRDRSALAMVIIAIYAVAVTIALVYIAAKGGLAIEKSCARGCDAIELWTLLADKIIFLITTAVIPIVTLMLGFYFGTEQGGKSDPAP